MVKQDIIEQVAEKANLTKADSARTLEALVDAITACLAKGEKVTWTGFGTFEVRHRGARMGRNPHTGAPMPIPATKTPAFKAGKGLKDAVRS